MREPEPDSYWVGFLGTALTATLDTDDIIEAHERAAAAICAVLIANPRIPAELRHMWIKAIIKEEVRNVPFEKRVEASATRRR